MNIEDLESQIRYYSMKYYTGDPQISDLEFESIVFESCNMEEITFLDTKISNCNFSKTNIQSGDKILSINGKKSDTQDMFLLHLHKIVLRSLPR